MKKKILLSLLISSVLFPLASCDSTKYTTFKEYVDIVNNQQEGQRDIFVFSSTKCAHCQKILPLIEKYQNENLDNDLNIHILSVDYKTFSSNGDAFKDETMGYISGDSTNDCMKRLDNRITKFVVSQGIIPSSDSYITLTSSKKYTYTVTPLMLWYENKLEVKIVNNVSKCLVKDEDGNIVYDSFKELMEFPEVNPSWNQTFDLQSYEKDSK